MAKPISILLLLISILLLVFILRTERATIPRPASEQRDPERIAAKAGSSQAKGIERQSRHPAKPPAQAPSPSEEEEEGLSSLEGSVTSEEDGSPIPDAVVTIYSATTEIERTATASPDGSYLFSGLLPGTYVISCESKGYEGREEEEPMPVVVGKRSQHNFRLTPLLVVRGSVKDRDGNPIADAEVEIQSSPPVRYDEFKTGEDGHYEASIVGEYHSFTVSKIGYVTERRWIEGKPKQVDFVLNRRRRRQVEVFGTVKDSEGKPLPDMWVSLSLTWEQGDISNTVGMEDYLSMSDGTPELSIMAKSDPTGNYRIQTTFCGEDDRLFLIAAKYCQELLLTDGENRIRRDIVLPRKLGGTTTVRGKVIDGVTKLPLEGVKTDGIKSGADGEFTLVTEGPKSCMWIGFKKEGYSSYQGVRFLHDPDHPREIDLGEIPLYPPAKVLCSVHDETGLSVQPGFEIICAGRDLTISGLTFDNDNIASFEVGDIPAEGVQATMIVNSMYHEPCEETVLLHAGAVTRLEIVMKSRQLSSYTIMVTESRGNPIAGAVVVFRGGGAITDLSGKASISMYGGGDCYISARGYGEEHIELSDVKNVVSVVLSPTLSISGRVVAEDGTIVVGALLYIKAMKGDPAMRGTTRGNLINFSLSGESLADGATDAQGYFEIKGLRSDNTYNLYTVHPYRQLRSDTMTGVAPGANDVTLIAKRNIPGELVIHFIGEEPPEGEGCTIRISGGDSMEWISQSRFDFVKNRRIKGEGVNPGLYTIELWGDHFSAKTITDVRISPGASAVLDIEVERGITLAGRLVDRNGKPVIGKPVLAADGQEDITSLDGSFRIEHVSSSVTKIYIRLSDEDDPREIDISGRDLAHLILTYE